MIIFKKTTLGIELGSTRIKAVVLDENHKILAVGIHDWENKFENGIWTYSLNDIQNGIQSCYKNLTDEVFNKYGQRINTFGAIGISAMMHGYFPLDKDGNQLCEFRTWRNTITGEAAERLSALFDFNIPQRWSIAHLYQAILNDENHLSQIDYLTTLAGYIHFKLTGEKMMGIGEASGMFPIDSNTFEYDKTMVEVFNDLIHDKKYSWKLEDILPKILKAGEYAGSLTEEGAKFLDPSLNIQPGIPFVPCEGDAQTGMVVTNSIRAKTCNVSAGTSDFAMVVMDNKIGSHKEIGMVTTPSGLPVAMVHCNNCTSDINAWVNLFHEFSLLFDMNISKNDLFAKLYNIALEGEKSCSDLISYNYYSGESVTELNAGRPLFIRSANSEFSLANFMRSNLYSALSTLKIGMDILLNEEKVEIDSICGHGGYFKTKEVGQRILSSAIATPVSVYESAPEGGPFGMALLASYMINKEENESLEDFLDNKVFKNAKKTTIMATQEEIDGFNNYVKRYAQGLEIEKKAVEILK